jgi:sugar lactone lactonase YvrE
VLAASLAAGAAAAHPAVGIVMDSRGNVFYSDLAQVWRIAPDGGKSVAVPRVHTHELALDGQDNLYGEHLWYEGDETKQWGHYVWKRAPDGQVSKVIAPRRGFLTDYSFVRDRAGTMYWADREASVIRKRLADGRVAVHARAPFRDVRWMTTAPDGTLYLIDTTDLVRITPEGQVVTVARSLSRPNPFWPFTGERHLLMGLWADGHGGVFVADYASRQVKRIAASGEVSVVETSSLGWSPTGGLMTPGGDLWVLEYSAANQVRARRAGRH